MKRLKLFAFVGLSALVGASLLRAMAWAPGVTVPEAGAAANQEASQAAGPGAAAQLRRGRVRPGLHNALEALGDRMVGPGKERVVLTATLTRGGGETADVLVIREFPDFLRVEERGRGGGRNQVLTFDGRGAGSSSGSVSVADEELVETLVYDSAEYFFHGQPEGAATRLLGSGYRLDGSESFEHDGPSYDVYESAASAPPAGEDRERVKRFYFNSTTHLLEWVKYEAVGGGVPARVVVQFGDWLEVQGQRVPGRVVRTVDERTSFELKVTSAGFAQRANDGAFNFRRN